jgi:hypothetical protein
VRGKEIRPSNFLHNHDYCEVGQYVYDCEFRCKQLLKLLQIDESLGIDYMLSYHDAKRTFDTNKEL